MKNLKLFNTLGRKKELFEARNNKVGMYVCGITPYSVTHLGHAFTYTCFDVLSRYLKQLGYKVMYVQNLTDIDDDILKKAKQEKTNWRTLGQENTQKFLHDLRWLNNVQPDVYPRATDHIERMTDIIAGLLKKGFAYEKNGNVYFAVGAYREYGRLSRLSKKEMLRTANQRGNNPDDPDKKDPLDFVLWQSKKAGEPSWLSPWGLGRPGWHIECSAMATQYLGHSVDIHGGGADLVFPHHESEIAQSQSASRRRFGRYWMHVGMLKYKGEKMSKSLGNLVLVEDLKKHYATNTVRIYLLSHQYRSAFEFFEKDMKKAQATATLFKKVWRVQSAPKQSLAVSNYEQAFYEAMNDDLDTPKALDTIRILAQQILKNRRTNNVTDAKAFLNKTFGILGLLVEYQ